MKFPSAQELHFDIDDHLNRFVPHSRLSRLPKPISRFLGYRETASQEVGNILIATWSLVGTFCGLTIVSSVFKYSSSIHGYNPPVLIASLGAVAILNYNVIQSPLAQPRSAIFGHTVAAIVGVAVTKLFMLSPHFEDLRWVAGPLGCGVASWVMTMTNCIYPPGGATALLAATDSTVSAMGWMFVPIVLLGSVLMFSVALVVNNVQRQYPLYWWTARDVGRQTKKDIEEASECNEDEIKDSLGEKEGVDMQHRIVITEDRILLPEGFALDPEQTEFLESLRDRLRTADRQYGFGSGSDSDLTPRSSRDIFPSLKLKKSNDTD